MRALHDYPVLDPADIKAVIPGNDLSLQVERVRVTPQPISVDEMSKLWTTFSAQYRTSAAYQVTVVLIESQRAAKTPLPVLARSQGDTGPTAQGNIDSPFPEIDAIDMPTKIQFAVQLGETFGITGRNLAATKVTVVLAHSNGAITLAPHPMTPEAGATATALAIKLPADTDAVAATWPAGVYQVTVVLEQKGVAQPPTNQLALPLAAKFKVVGVPAIDGSGNATFTVTCRPPLFPGQRAMLLVGDRSLDPEAVDFGTPAAPVKTLTFVLKQAKPGKYYVRLRIDGVDSLIVPPDSDPPAFDNTLQVTL